MRRFTRKRPFRRKLRGDWVQDTFANDLETDAVATRLPIAMSMFERDDFEAAGQIINKYSTLLHVRAMASFNFRPLVNGVGSLSLAATVRWALCIADTESDDIAAAVSVLDSPSTGTLLQGGERLLRVGQASCLVHSPQTISATGNPDAMPMVDRVISWSGRRRVGPDDLVVLVAWLSTPTTDVSSYMVVSCNVLSRVYIHTR